MNVIGPPVALARHAIRFEVGVWRSLYFLVRGRDPGAGPGAEKFSYVKAVELLFWVFIIVSAIEIPIAHMLVPWEPVKIALLAVGFWGLMWMVGMLAAYKVHTHLVEPAGLRLRNGFTLDVTIPWEAISAVSVRERSRERSRAVQLDETDTGTILNLVVASRTNVAVTLDRPVTLALPHGSQTVTAVRFFADDPRAIMMRIRTNLEDRQGTANTAADKP